MKVNYQLICDKEIEELARDGKRPRLLLQSCCGPCSSYVLEYLTKFFDVTVFFSNSNIYPKEEFDKRLMTQHEVTEKLKTPYPVKLVADEYDHEEFLDKVAGLEGEPEGGMRCVECFRLRLLKTAEFAKENGFDCFTTTLSVSPHKNAEILNSLGKEIGESVGVFFLTADFKKREGYKRSIELSRELDLYRQEYCGCEFSIR